MQRISDGLAVPKHMTEVFSGKTTDANGLFTCDLKYVPQSVQHVLISQRNSDIVQSQRFYAPRTVAGNVLTVFVRKLTYMESANATGGANSGGAGADPHTHTITKTSISVATPECQLEAQAPVTVHYQVA